MIYIFFISFNYSGAQTYADQLLYFLRNKSDLAIYEVNISSCFNELEVENIGSSVASGIGWKLSIPKVSKLNYVENKYIQIDSIPPLNILYNWLQPLKKEEIIFHCNTENSINMIERLKEHINFKLVSTIHFLPKHYYWKELGNYNEDVIETTKETYDKQLKISDKIICVTQFANDYLIKNSNVDGDKVSVVYNGYTANSNQYISNRQKYGISDKDIVVLFVGRIDPNKGIYELIAAFECLLTKYTNLKLVLIGGGDQMLIEPFLKKYKDSIILMSKQTTEVVKDFYTLSDIGVLPSKAEQCSYVALEMMNHKLPIIATKLPGFNELFIDNETALLVDVKQGYDKDGLLDIEIDTKMLEHCLETFIRKKELRMLLAEKGYKRWSEQFAAQRMADKTYEIYKNLMVL